MTGDLRGVIMGGVGLIVGVLMVIIGVAFMPELVSGVTDARETANWTDYTGLDAMSKMLPTFGMMALVFGGGLLSFLSGRKLYHEYK